MNRKRPVGRPRTRWFDYIKDFGSNRLGLRLSEMRNAVCVSGSKGMTAYPGAAAPAYLNAGEEKKSAIHRSTSN